MFRVTKYARSLEVKSERTTQQNAAETSPSLRESSCSRNLRNYISDVTVDYFFFRFSKSTDVRLFFYKPAC